MLADELVDKANDGSFQPLEPEFKCESAEKLTEPDGSRQQTMIILVMATVIMVFLLLVCLLLSSKSQAKYDHWLKDPKAQELPPGWSDEEPKAPLADVVVPAVAQPLPGWVVRCTAAGERYYYNVESGETAATEGAWEKRDPGNGRVYWRNKVTKEITFIEPSGVGAALDDERVPAAAQQPKHGHQHPPWQVEYPPYRRGHKQCTAQFSPIDPHGKDWGNWALDPKDLLPSPHQSDARVVPDHSTMERVKELEQQADRVATKAEQEWNFLPRSLAYRGPATENDEYWSGLAQNGIDPLVDASHALAEMREECDRV